MTNFDPLPEPDPQDFAKLLSSDALAYERLKSNDSARERLTQEKAQRAYRPFARGKNAAQRIAEGLPEYEWTVKPLAAKGMNTLLLGDLKAGKSTLIMNLLRSLADSVPYLNIYPVRTIEGNIGYLDFELGEMEFYDRLQAMNVGNLSKLHHLDLVGMGFDILAPVAYEDLVSWIVEFNIEVLIIDPIRHLAKYEDGNKDSKIIKITDKVDQLRRDAPCLVDIFAPAHSAKGAAKGERLTVLGSAAWDGWAQFRWYAYGDEKEFKWYFKLGMSRRTDKEAASLREVVLDHDGNAGLGVSTAQSADKQMRASMIRSAITDYVKISEGCKKTELRDSVSRQLSISPNDVQAAINGMATNLDLTIVDSERDKRVKLIYTRDHYDTHARRL